MSKDELDRLLDKLGLAQRIRLLTGATVWRTHPAPEAGLRPLVMSDGPVGVRGESWDERSTSVVLPSPTALAAAWDEGLVREVCGVLARQARRKDVDVLLAPTLNLHRSPLAGRHFECFSEDPLLTARTGAAFISGLQAHGVAATAKHYVANDSETERMTLDARVGERVLREVYLPPFEAAVAAGVWVVMAAYNRVNGVTMTHSPLLEEPLKGEWGFDGLVVSDWGALRSAVAPARGGLDLAMPGPGGPWAAGLAEAVAAGEVSREAIGEKAGRLLRLAGRTGALRAAGHPRAGSTPAGPLSGVSGTPGPSVSSSRPGAPETDTGDTADRADAADTVSGARVLLRRAVSASTVLLRNEGPLLPLDPARLRRLAVLGPNAAAARIQGGGSAGVHPVTAVSPLEGLRAALSGAAEVVHAPGVRFSEGPPPLDAAVSRNPRSGEPGLLVRLLDAAGRELHAEHRLTGRLPEPAEVPGAAHVELRAVLRAGEAGAWEIELRGLGRLTLTAGGRVLLDEEIPLETDDPTLIHVRPPARSCTLRLAAGEETELVARRRLDPGTGRATLLSAGPPRPDAGRELAGAAELAGACDAAVVVVGTTDEVESEGWDRASLALPGGQDALVEAVAAANPRTVVVVNSGGPVALPWRERVPALLVTWFPGQEGGHGLADVLLGRAEPGGRLPTTWADRSLTGVTPVEGRLEYTEGLHLGYRGWLREAGTPAFWFGHGLGYTTWSYEELSAPARLEAGEDCTVRVRLANAGSRAGREVVQVYLARSGSALERPVRWLAGYAAVTAEPGERAEAAVTLDARSFQHWSPGESPGEGRWATEPGTFAVLAGPSAGEVPLSAAVTVAPPGA